MIRKAMKRKAFCGMMAALLAAGTSVPVSAETTQQQVATVQATISNLESLKSDSEAYLTELSSQLSTLTDEIENLQKQSSVTEENIQVVQVELDAANKKSAQQSEDMKERIKYMYENTENINLWTSLFSEDSFLDFLNKAEFIVSVDNYDREKLEEYQQTQKEIEEKKAALQEEQDNITALQAESQQKIQEVQQLYDSTSAQVAEYAASIVDQQSVQAQLLAAVQQKQTTLNTVVTQSAAQQVTGDITSTVTTEISTLAGSVSNTINDNSSTSSYEAAQSASTYSGSVLTKQSGVNYGPSGKETYYNLSMTGVIQIMRDAGYTTEEYWVRDDGVKMFGDYIMVAADQNVHPLGSVYETSLGMAIVCDTGDFIYDDPNQTDIAVAW